MRKGRTQLDTGGEQVRGGTTEFHPFIYLMSFLEICERFYFQFQPDRRILLYFINLYF